MVWAQYSLLKCLGPSGNMEVERATISKNGPMMRLHVNPGEGVSRTVFPGLSGNKKILTVRGSLLGTLHLRHHSVNLDGGAVRVWQPVCLAS